MRFSGMAAQLMATKGLLARSGTGAPAVPPPPCRCRSPLNEHSQLVLAGLVDLLAQPADHRRLTDQLIAEQLLVLTQPLPLPFI